jgi:hypothetical protein
LERGRQHWSPLPALRPADSSYVSPRIHARTPATTIGTPGRLIAPHYPRAQLEGRTLVQTALASAADIKVTDAELLVTLVPLSSAHRSRAIAALCAKLNATATVFPGTRLRLRYAVAGQP